MALEAGVAYVDVHARLDKLEQDLKNKLGPIADKASKTFSDKLSSVGKSMQKVGKNMTKFVTAPIIGVGVASVMAATNVDKGLREVNTLFGETGAAADATFKQMQSGVADLSKEMGIAQTTLTGGLYQAISAGVPKENVFDFMRVASKAAIAGVTDTETAIDGITTIINAFGLKTEDAGRVADSMFTAVKGGKTTFDELSSAMFNVAPAAAAAGVKMEEVNAAIATLTASGTPTSVATTQLRAALTGLQKPSADLDAAFQKAGYQTAQMAIEAEGLGFALGVVKDASGGSNGELQKLLGSAEAVAAANVIAGTSAEKFAAEMEGQAQAAGATDKAFAEMEESAARKMERMKVAVQNAMIPIGEKLLPLVTKAAEKLVPMIEKAVKWFEKLSPSAKKFVGIGIALLAVAGPMLVILGSLATAVAALSLPFLAIIAVLGVLIYIGYKVISNWDQVKKNFVSVKNVIISALQGILNMFLGWASTFLGAAATAFGWIPGIGGKLKDAKAAFDRFRDGVNRSLEGIKDKTINISIKSVPMTPALSKAIAGSRQARAAGINRQHGGPITAFRPYIVGEAGPELVVPRHSGTVIPNNALGGAVTNNFYISGAVDKAAAAREIEAILKQHGTHNGGVTFSRG